MSDRALRQLFLLANAFKEGDLAVGGTRDDDVRADARRALSASRLARSAGRFSSTTPSRPVSTAPVIAASTPTSMR